MKKQLLLFIIVFSLICLQFSCRNRNSNKDNLRYKQYNYCLNIIKDSLRTNPLLVRKNIDIALKLAQDSTEHYQVIENFFYYFIQTSEFDSALICHSQLKKYIDSSQNINSNTLLNLRYANSKGVYYSYTGLLDSSLFYYKKAYEISKNVKPDETSVDITINLADGYIRTGDYINGLKFYREALYRADSLNLNHNVLYSIYTGMGQAYYSGMRNFALSNEYFNKAESLLSYISENEKFIFYNNRGNAYFYQKDYRKSLNYFLKAREIVEKNKNDYNKNLCYLNLSDVYLKLNKTDSASYFYDKCENYFHKLNIEMYNSYRRIIGAGIELNKMNVTKAGKILYQNSDNDYTDPEILALRFKVMEDYYLKSNNYENAYKYQKKYNALNDSLRSWNVKNAINELDMRYRQDTALLIRENLIIEKDSEIKSLRNNIIYWSIFIVLAGIALMFYLTIKKRNNELNRLKMQDNLIKLRMQNIRNRISPHFIFNVLNYEISEQKSNTNDSTLIPLVKLLRQSLLLTENLKVNLNDEIEFVRNYIEIESKKMEDFDYEIITETGFNTTKYYVLSMIIQIPVENAIKHALKPIKGLKKLIISIMEIEQGLLINITDNGLGYMPELNTATKGTGTGLNVVFRTIAMLNEKNSQKIIFNIQNIAENEHSGTHVLITIPNDFNYDI